MDNDTPIVPLYTDSGKLYGVLLCPEAWALVKDDVEQKLGIAGASPKPTQKPEPMEDWNTLCKYWDFRYPFTAAVTCEVCGNASEDWVHDEPRKFVLKAANLGGLAKFQCCQCRAAVIKRHFKDTIKCECIPFCEG